MKPGFSWGGLLTCSLGVAWGLSRGSRRTQWKTVAAASWVLSSVACPRPGASAGWQRSPAGFLSVGVKLGMQSIPVATACAIYHKFFCEIALDAYDPYLVAMSSLYLAGKVEEQHLRTRDIINVSNRYRLPGRAWGLPSGHPDGRPQKGPSRPCPAGARSQAQKEAPGWPAASREHSPRKPWVGGAQLGSVGPRGGPAVHGRVWA